MKSKRFSMVTVRPDLRWIEESLGESLGEGLEPEPDVPPELGQVNPALDASVIPMGEYCYYSPNLIAGFVPCPYFTYTRYGTAKCDFLNIEAYDPEDSSVQRKVAAHFGGTEQVVAAGIIGHSYFSDQFKVCGINQESITYVAGDLDKAIALYADAVAGHRFADRYAWGRNNPHFSDEHRRMLTAAYDRFNVWEALCERLEDVPRSSVDLIVKTDALFRSLTASSDEVMDGCAAYALHTNTEPNKQFWYFYRKNVSLKFKSRIDSNRPLA